MILVSLFRRDLQDCVLLRLRSGGPEARRLAKAFQAEVKAFATVFLLLEEGTDWPAWNPFLPKAWIRQEAKEREVLGYPLRQAKVEAQRPKGEEAWREDLPLLAFYKTHPPFRRYWLVEGELVNPEGWAPFFEAFRTSKADLVALNVRRHSSQPDSPAWNDISGPQTVPLYRRVIAQLPLCGLSHRALGRLSAAYAQGWDGDWRVLVPTLLSEADYLIEDIGGIGEFVRKSNERRFYLPDSFEGPQPPASGLWWPRKA